MRGGLDYEHRKVTGRIKAKVTLKMETLRSAVKRMREESGQAAQAQQRCVVWGCVRRGQEEGGPCWKN